MKCKMKIILVSVAVVVSIIGYCKIHQSENLNTLLLKNVEALADDEDFGRIDCFGLGSVDCPITHIKVVYATGTYSLY